MSTETLSAPTGSSRRSRRMVRRLVEMADAIAAPHGVDGYLELFAPTWSSTEVRGRIVEVDRSADGSVVITIDANGNWTGFAAGQYTQLSVEIDGVRHTRCYSMANAAPGSEARNQRRIQLGIRAHPEGLVSRHLNAHARVGMVVGLTPAAGEFHLPAIRPERVLLISGGSGITPVMSMLRTLCAEGHTGPVAFVHYARNADAVLFADELHTIASSHANVEVHFAFDDDPRCVGDLSGRMCADHLDWATANWATENWATENWANENWTTERSTDANWTDADAYVCGPAPLMDAVRSLYDGAQASERFHQEAFTLTEFAAEADVAGTVSFSASDVAVASDGRVILDQAEEAGLSPASGCRMGICHTCTRPLNSGTVRNVVTGECTTANTSDVEIRVCVNAPVGDVTIDL